MNATMNATMNTTENPGGNSGTRSAGNPREGDVSAGKLSPVGRFERVLLATDGSEWSAGAERIAVALCTEHRAHLHVLSAISTPGEAGWLGKPNDVEAERQSKETLQRVEKLAREAGLACTGHLRCGDDPYEVIVQTARELSSDVVVMGRRGRRGLARLMLGDATAKVIGYAPCSVLVVPEDAHMWSSILVATDGSRFSDMAAVAAVELAKTGSVPLTVLSVKVPVHSARRQDEAQPIVDRVLEFIADQEVVASGLVASGVADDTIVEVAHERNLGLIVLGNFGRTGIGRMLFGSKAERVINQATTPVLIARGG